MATYQLQLYARFSDAPQEPGKAACLAMSLLSLEVSLCSHYGETDSYFTLQFGAGD